MSLCRLKPELQTPAIDSSHPRSAVRGSSALGFDPMQRKAASKRRPRKAAKSEWAEVRKSGIHGSGLFAKKAIPKGTRFIEYVGDKVIKAESERRSNLQDEKGRATGDGTVYTFILNSRYDIDGNVPWNDAKYANHSCDPNAATGIENDRVWLVAERDIGEGEEITYDYCFDLSFWKQHPCRCGAENCLGYIVGEEHREKLKRKIAARDRRKRKK
jgi:hypothetical protein